MLALVAFKLVPLVEIFSTALTVTLKDKQRNRKLPTYFRIQRDNKTRGLYFVSLLLVQVDPSHVVLHAGVCDKGLRAPVSHTPGDHSRKHNRSEQ